MELCSAKCPRTCFIVVTIAHELVFVYSLALTIETLAITTVFLICFVYNVGPHTVVSVDVKKLNRTL